MFACLFVPDFPVQSVLRAEPEERRHILNASPVVVLDGPASLQRAFALNQQARMAGIQIGMTKLQVESCGKATVRRRSLQQEESAQAALLDCAHSFSPFVESTAPGIAAIDLAGTEKLFGPPQKIAREIAARGEALGLELHVGIAANPDSACHAAKGFQGSTIIPSGEEAQRLASLPLDVLSPPPELLEVLDSWGIHTFKALAMLPPVPLVQRLGQEGLRLQKLARGDMKRTLVPVEPSPEFVESFEFEDPIETVESLSFVLNRLLQNLCARLSSRALATNELHLGLELEARQITTENANETYQRSWKLPIPTSNAHMLFRLACLDLHSTTFSAPVSKVWLRVLPVKPRFTQEGMFASASLESEKLEITLARIRGIVGNTDENGISRVGTPIVLDSHKPDSFAVTAAPQGADCCSGNGSPVIALRIFRPPILAAVEVREEKPVSVLLKRRRLPVIAASGPWHTSGEWWSKSAAWARDEWDVALKTKEGTGIYRIYFDRTNNGWFVEGRFD